MLARHKQLPASGKKCLLMVKSKYDKLNVFQVNNKATRMTSIEFLLLTLQGIFNKFTKLIYFLLNTLNMLLLGEASKFEAASCLKYIFF